MMTTDHLDQGKNIEDALVLTAKEVYLSNLLSENVALCYTLQKSVGLLQTTSNGYSAAQLRV